MRHHKLATGHRDGRGTLGTAYQHGTQTLTGQAVSHRTGDKPDKGSLWSINFQVILGTLAGDFRYQVLYLDVIKTIVGCDPWQKLHFAIIVIINHFELDQTIPQSIERDFHICVRTGIIDHNLVALPRHAIKHDPILISRLMKVMLLGAIVVQRDDRCLLGAVIILKTVLTNVNSGDGWKGFPPFRVFGLGIIIEYIPSVGLRGEGSLVPSTLLVIDQGDRLWQVTVCNGLRPNFASTRWHDYRPYLIDDGWLLLQLSPQELAGICFHVEITASFYDLGKYGCRGKRVAEIHVGKEGSFLLRSPCAVPIGIKYWPLDLIGGIANVTPTSVKATTQILPLENVLPEKIGKREAPTRGKRGQLVRTCARDSDSS